MKTKAAAICGLIGYAVAGCGAVDNVFLRPNKIVRGLPTDLGYEYEEIMLPTDAGGRVAIWHVRTPGARKGIIVGFPGMADNKSRYVLGLPLFVDEGWDMIMMDYEGFGDSSGVASLAGTVRSARTVIEYALSQDDTVVGFGFSFGTAVLARTAAEYELTACVFDGTLDLWRASTLFAEHNLFVSPLAVLADVGVALSTPQDFDTKYWITKVQEPKLFIHSPDDNLNPIEGAWEIFKNAPQPKFFFTVQGEHVTQALLDPVLYRSFVNGWLDGLADPGPVHSVAYHELLEEELQRYLFDLYQAVPLIN